MAARAMKTQIRRSRLAFTLVELLVSIAIIGVMAGMVLYTLAGAQQDALRTRTRGTIDKINAVLLERWEGYRYRSVKLPVPAEALQKKWITPRQVATLRSLFLKDMMRMEMPDSYVDLAYTPTNRNLTLTNGNMNFKGSPGREYNVLRNYFRMGQVLDTAPAATPIPSTKPSPHWSDRYESAECLYAIVAHSTSGGGSALEGFAASEIGDTDGDGFAEFIDAWGEPISWIRWPAGYASELNLGYKATSPDAFDPLRTAPQWGDATLTQKPWTVVPLVVSSGTDKQFGIDRPVNVFATSQNVFVPSTDAPGVGLISNANQAADNVSNHDLLLE
ncbi:MAG: type II secretion system protein [Pirellulaceae bacterium]|nr:type II secretion system protein [Pirellulaceae bacterium]